jgi:hypothetical protein
MVLAREDLALVTVPSSATNTASPGWMSRDLVEVEEVDGPRSPMRSRTPCRLLFGALRHQDRLDPERITEREHAFAGDDADDRVGTLQSLQRTLDRIEQDVDVDAGPCPSCCSSSARHVQDDLRRRTSELIRRQVALPQRLALEFVVVRQVAVVRERDAVGWLMTNGCAFSTPNARRRSGSARARCRSSRSVAPCRPGRTRRAPDPTRASGGTGGRTSRCRPRPGRDAGSRSGHHTARGTLRPAGE